MNDLLIKRLIRYKIDISEKIINYMPTNISKEIKNMGRIVLEEINEASEGRKASKGHENINNVPIE